MASVPRGLQPEAFGLNSQVFRARLSLFNPNAVPLRVARGNVELSLAGVPAARGRVLEPFTVASGQTADVDIRVTMHLLRDAPALFERLAANGASDGLAYALNGYVDVERHGLDRVPIQASGTLAAWPRAGTAPDNAAAGGLE